MLGAIVDRPHYDAALAVAAAWAVLMAGLLAGGDVVDPVSFAMAGGIGAALIYVGFVAASRCRVLSVALGGSALVFAALHLGRPFPDDPALTNYYRVTLLMKYTLAGLPLGWVFWRWGLPYAILCHMAANAAHLALQAKLF